MAEACHYKEQSACPRLASYEVVKVPDIMHTEVEIEVCSQHLFLAIGTGMAIVYWIGGEDDREDEVGDHR